MVFCLFLVQARAAVTNEECLGCHDTLGDVSHGGAGCLDCHSTVTDLPHAEKLPRPACAACHEHVAALYKSDIHETKGLGCAACHNAHHAGKEEKRCATCHNRVSHATLPGKEKHLGNLACVACHGKPEKTQLKVRAEIRGARAPDAAHVDRDGNGIVDPAEWQRFEASLRGASETKAAAEGGVGGLRKRYVVTGGSHTVAGKRVDCARCHSAGGYFNDATLTVADSTSYTLRLDPRIFVRAFPSEKDFSRTVHGKSGVTCADCHGAAKTARPGSPAWAIGSSACTKCHEDIERVYGLSRHAKMGAARCLDCHDPHGLRPYRELRAKERMAVCARCHTGYLTRHSWLPNTALHFGYLECATCHSPGSGKSMVYFFARKSDGAKTPLAYNQLAAAAGEDPLAFVESLASIEAAVRGGRQKAGADGYDAGIGRLFTALRERDRGTIIDASIIVTKVYHDYSETRLKEKECVTCHSREAGFYDSMFFLIPGKESVRYVPMKGTLFSSYPIGTAVDFFLLGEDKLTKRDFATFLGLKRGGAPGEALGFKLIDLAGLVVLLLVLAAFCIHIALRVLLVKR